MRSFLCNLSFCLLLGISSYDCRAQEQTPAQPKSLATASSAAPSQADDAAKPKIDAVADLKRLNGIWRPKSAVLAGGKIPEAVCENIQLTVTDGRFSSISNGAESTGTIQLEVAKQPQAMDMTFESGAEAGKTIRCIYKFEKNELHVAFSVAFDDVRPTDFTSNQDNKLLLIVYEPAPSSPQAPREDTRPTNLRTR